MFQALLRCIKFWAKKRGVYGNLFGFLGGVHLAILAASVCQRYPDASMNGLVTTFFRTFAHWKWPMTPVCLQDGLPHPNFTANPRTMMPIRLPCKPNEFCHSNISESTYYKIKKELNRGYSLCMDECLNPWARLFEAYPYTRKYNRFIKICLSASDPHKLGNWTGWIKSRFPTLLLQLEAIQWLCDPNPTEHVDSNVLNPNIVFYWGLERNGYLDIKAVREHFLMTLPKKYNSSCRGKITMAVVKVDQLPKFAEIDTETNTSTNI